MKNGLTVGQSSQTNAITVNTVHTVQQTGTDGQGGDIRAAGRRGLTAKMQQERWTR